MSDYYERQGKEKRPVDLEGQKKAALLAQEQWSNHPDPTQTPDYFIQKGIKIIPGIRSYQQTSGIIAVIPMYNLEGNIVGLQKLYPMNCVNGNKEFTKGCAKKHSFFLIGKITPETKRVGVCEGLATGASIYEATKIPIFVCWDVWNMRDTVPLLIQKYPGIKFDVFSDNDEFRRNQKHFLENIGSIVSEQLAKTHKLRVFYPQFILFKDKSTSDFNDMHKQQGIKAVKEWIDKGPQPRQQYIGHKFNSMTLIELQEGKTPEMSWLVDGLITECGSSGLFSRERTGKTTIATEIAYCVLSDNENLWGRKTMHGPVAHFAFEEDAGGRKSLLKPMGFPNGNNYHLIIGRAGNFQNFLKDLQEFIYQTGVKLIFLDTLISVFPVLDLNNYNETYGAIAPYTDLGRKMRVNICWAHHTKKDDAGIGSRAIMGSAAIPAAIDTTLMLSRSDDGVRTIYSEQRYGKALPKSVVEFDERSGRSKLLGTTLEVKNDNTANEIVSCLKRFTQLSAKEMAHKIKKGHETVDFALDSLMSKGWVEKIKGDRNSVKYQLSKMMTTENPAERKFFEEFRAIFQGDDSLSQ